MMSYKSIIFDFQSDEGAVPSIRSKINREYIMKHKVPNVNFKVREKSYKNE